MALAALIIKEELGASDRAYVEQITENPYLQYFCGLKVFITDPPFDVSMFVHFRKRFPADVLSEVNNAIAAKICKRQDPSEAESGAKVSISLVDGVSFVDTISWDNFNEGGDLIAQIESYRERFGCYPESVHADKIYRNRDNRRYCKKKGIRLSGPRLGRPPNVTESNAQMLRH